MFKFLVGLEIGAEMPPISEQKKMAAICEEAAINAFPAIDFASVGGNSGIEFVWWPALDATSTRPYEHLTFLVRISYGPRREFSKEFFDGVVIEADFSKEMLAMMIRHYASKAFLPMEALGFLSRVTGEKFMNSEEIMRLLAIKTGE